MNQGATGRSHKQQPDKTEQDEAGATLHRWGKPLPFDNSNAQP
jgi:hypothetical protein